MTVRNVRLVFVLTLAALAGGCGFHPLYGSMDGQGGAREVFSSIFVDPIEGEHVGYELRNSLIGDIEGTEKPTDATYRLKVRVTQYLQAIAVADTGVVTRYNYTLHADYELSDIRTNKIVNSGAEQTLSAYDVVASPYATLVAEQDAQKRGASDIAYRIRIALSAYFAAHPKAK